MRRLHAHAWPFDPVDRRGDDDALEYEQPYLDFDPVGGDAGPVEDGTMFHPRDRRVRRPRPRPEPFWDFDPV